MNTNKSETLERMCGIRAYSDNGTEELSTTAQNVRIRCVRRFITFRNWNKTKYFKHSMFIVDQNNNLKHQPYGDIRFRQWTMHQIRLSFILTCLPDNPAICYSVLENTRTVSLTSLCKLINTQVNIQAYSPTLRQPLPDRRSSVV